MQFFLFFSFFANILKSLLIGLGTFINYYNTERIKLKFKTSPVKYRQMQEKNN